MQIGHFLLCHVAIWVDHSNTYFLALSCTFVRENISIDKGAVTLRIDSLNREKQPAIFSSSVPPNWVIHFEYPIHQRQFIGQMTQSIR